MLITVLSLGLAVTALLVSAFLAVRQLRATLNSDSVNVAIELLSEFRDPEMVESRRALLTELPRLPPTLGFAGLPEPLRAQTYRVSHFFDHVGMLIAHKMVPPGPMIGFFGRSALSCWQELSPFIYHERRRRNTVYQEYYDIFVQYMDQEPPELIIREARRRLLGRSRRATAVQAPASLPPVACGVAASGTPSLTAPAPEA